MRSADWWSRRIGGDPDLFIDVQRPKEEVMTKLAAAVPALLFAAGSALFLIGNCILAWRILR